MSKIYQGRIYRLFPLLIAFSLFFPSVCIPLILTSASAVEDVPELNERGGIVDVRVGPTPRYGSLVLGLVYISISEESLGKVKLNIEAASREQVPNQEIWLELWTGRIQPSESVWWVDRTKLAASDINNLRLEYVPIVARVMTLAIVWIKSDNRDTISVRVNVTSSPIEIIESPPTINDVLLESSDTPESPVFADLVSKLGRDPVKIHEYVRNNVFFDTYWGVLRGGLRTYYDSYGNSLDQSSLLISLLRTAGFPARYAFGVVKIPLTTLAETLGLRITSSNIDDAVQIYRLAGLLHYADRNNAMIYHVWVRAFINGTWIDLDPSLKKIVVKTDLPISGLANPPLTIRFNRMGRRIRRIRKASRRLTSNRHNNWELDYQ